VITLEGGYHVHGQRDSVKEVLKELSGISKTSLSNIIDEGDPRTLESIIQKVAEVHSRHWKNV
jgi:hypothetical protein